MTKSSGSTDSVNRPSHYQSEGGMECIDVIESFELGFHLGNAIKYILRAGKKGDVLEDLRKAVWYLQRYIAHVDIERRIKEISKPADR